MNLYPVESRNGTHLGYYLPFRVHSPFDVGRVLHGGGVPPTGALSLGFRNGEQFSQSFWDNYPQSQPPPPMGATTGPSTPRVQDFWMVGDPVVFDRVSLCVNSIIMTI